MLLDDWHENHRLLISLVEARKVTYAALRARPRLDLAMFWAWKDKPRPTRSRDTDDHGDFYPAFGSRPAAFNLFDARLAPPQALRILARHGVPIRLRAPGRTHPKRR